MNNLDLKKLIIPNIPYLLFVWLFGKAAQAFRLSPGADLSEKLLALGTGFSAAFENAAPSLHPMDLLIGIAGAVLIRLIVYFKGKNAKKYRKGVEYGSARCGARRQILVNPYIQAMYFNPRAPCGARQQKCTNHYAHFCDNRQISDAFAQNAACQGILLLFDAGKSCGFWVRTAQVISAHLCFAL